MLFGASLIEGTLVRRYKRFLADVRLADGSETTAHCANPGSMLGLAEPGSRILLRDVGETSKRKLRFTWEVVRVGRAWVMVNTLRANQLAGESLRDWLVPELAMYPQVQPEVRVSSESRIDFCLSGGRARRKCFVEVKSVTLREGPMALFPDAVTQRGRRHLEELARLRRERHRAVLLFLVMRNDCRAMGPADAIDPAYGETLRWAVRQGVEVLAYEAHVSRRGATLGERLPVRL